MKKNVIVGQSGGPTAVINASLAGVYKTAKDMGADTIYGMRYGIQGLLEKKIVDLGEKIRNDMDVELLKRTPASFLGSCRYKLPESSEDKAIYEKIFAILEELEITAFFYIGGNDSMDTIKKLSDYAQTVGSPIRFIGVPKTIDNDLEGTDHTPGYGSAAKYIATVTKVPFDVDVFLEKVKKLVAEKQSIVIAVSEGIKTADGRYVCELSAHSDKTDSFGHVQLSGTGKYLSDLIIEKLGCKSRAIELSTLQRCAGHLTSRVDITEAYQVGGTAVKAAFEGKTGQMVILKRVSQDPYICTTDLYDVHKVANLEKKVPRSWITEEGDYVTAEMKNYIEPLIQAELTPIMITGQPRHIIIDDLPDIK